MRVVGCRHAGCSVGGRGADGTGGRVGGAHRAGCRAGWTGDPRGTTWGAEGVGSCGFADSDGRETAGVLRSGGWDPGAGLASRVRHERLGVPVPRHDRGAGEPCIAVHAVG